MAAIRLRDDVLIANRQIAVYSPVGPDGMMLKKYQNDGDYDHGQIGANLAGKFLDGRLSFSVSPGCCFIRQPEATAYRIIHYW